MSIVATEIESIHGSAQRMIFYRCQDHLGVWHSYGPIITTDAGFDADAFKPTVAEKVADRLAEVELMQAIS
jgi:hypothetical protein